MNINYHISEKSGIKIISIQGSWMEENQSKQLIHDIEILISQGNNQLIVDLSELQYMNSSGLNVLIHILTKARKSGGELIIANVPAKINNLLILSKLNTVFSIADSIEKAIEMLSLEMSS